VRRLDNRFHGAQANDPTHDGFLVKLTIALAVGCLLFLCVYSFVIATQTYERVVIPGPGKPPENRKIIGGFVLTDEAKEVQKKERVPIQEVLMGATYDVDRVWTRPSRALARIVFLLCYLGLTVSGTVAIAGAAMLIGHSQQSP